MSSGKVVTNSTMNPCREVITNAQDAMNYISQELENGVKQYIGTGDRLRQPKCREIEGFIESTENRLKKSKGLTSILERTLENLQSFSFKEGDIIISRSQGNGIVCGIGVGLNEEACQIDEDFPDKFYVVIATKNGYIKVPPEDVMPYTTASKVLYERS